MKQKNIFPRFIIVSLPLLVLSIFFTLGPVFAASAKTGPQIINQTESVFLQSPVTSTVTSPISGTLLFQLTFEDLGFGETVLTSPIDREKYDFRLPDNWQLRENNFIEFDLSYHYSSLDTSSELPATFGDLHIILDDQTLEIFTLEAPNLDHQRLRVPLPASLFNDKPGPHTLELTFDASFFCAIPHNATLVIHPTTFLSFDYAESPLTLDLSTYPLPFYQKSFIPDEVTFGLPAQPGPAEAAGIVSLAAKLGHLTNNHMNMTASTDLDLVNTLSVPSSTFEQHVFVIGQPQHNRLLPLLNELTDLPVSLHPRQMGLTTQGPEHVSPGQVFTYTFTVTNTGADTATFSLLDTLPAFTEFVDCQPDCLTGNNAGSLSWNNHRFAPAEAKNFSLILQATDIITNPYLENTITLLNDQQAPINGDSLVSQVNLGPLEDQASQVSTAAKSEYFFIFNGKAVAENDGIIQEIISPWNQNRAILIVTGLNDEAIRKASWAMSSEARFPGMLGPVALVQDAFPPEVDITTPPPTETTLRDLGYEDQILRGRFSQRINYSFFLPLGWQLTDQAVLDLRYTHAEFIEQTGAGFTVMLNDMPIATVALSNETATGGSRQINLPAAAARPGEQNRLTIEFIPVGGGSGERCDGEGLFKDFWLVINSDSKLVLDHTQALEQEFDLSIYPYPFDDHPSLIDLLFALPATPAISEWQNTLAIAANLGNSAGGQTILPAVTLGDDYRGKELADYHIIAIGRPSHHALIQEVNSTLPQPFIPKTDQIQQQIDDFIFRLPPGIELGYLQLGPSSWNAAHALLTVTGTSDQGVTWATQVLADNRFKQLKGNLALVREDNIYNINTRKLMKEGIAVAASKAVPELAESTPAPARSPMVSGTPLPNVPFLTEANEAASSPTAALPDSRQAQAFTPNTATEEAGIEAAIVDVEKEYTPPLWLLPLAGITFVAAIIIFITPFVRSKRQHL